MEDLVFSNFCAEIGVANIREYEQENLKQQQEVDRKRYRILHIDKTSCPYVFQDPHSCLGPFHIVSKVFDLI